MGYEQLTFSGSARLSRHNSGKDAWDNMRWKELCAVLDELEHEYQDLSLIVMVDRVDET